MKTALQCLIALSITLLSLSAHSQCPRIINTISEHYFGQGAVAVDGVGNVYFADTWNHRVYKVAATTGVVTSVAGDGNAGYSGDFGAATIAELNGPSGIAVDGNGNIYIADQYNNRIRKIWASSGIITTVAGGGGGYLGDGGNATNATLSYPSGVAVDGSGNIYIADQYNNRVRKVAPTGIISTVAGNGSWSYSGDGSAAVSAGIPTPSGVAVDGSGNLFIADNGSARIRKVSAAGIISTVAGNGTVGYSGDEGAATAAMLSNPAGIAVDGSGNLYVADEGNYRIRKITTSGIISTVAGNGSYSSFGDAGEGGLATSAAISPSGIAADVNGNVYISDWGYNRIRRIGNGVLMCTITGDATVCTGATIALANSIAGGTWSSSFPSRASIDDAGVVHGLIAGGVTISYTVTNSCGTGHITKYITVIAANPSIYGSGNLNIGSKIVLLTGASGATSSDESVLSVRDTTIYTTEYAIVEGRSAGQVIITVSGHNSCGDYTATKLMEVEETDLILTAPYDFSSNSISGNHTGAGALAVASGKYQVYSIDPYGGHTVVAGNGNAEYKDSAAIPLPYFYPPIMSLDATSSGILPLAVADNHILSWTALGPWYDGSGLFYIDRLVSGHLVRVAGNGTTGYSGDGGPATSASMLAPRYMAADRWGNLYVNDGTDRIRKISSSGIITTIAGTGMAGYSGDGESATAAQIYGDFFANCSIAVDSVGNVYFAQFATGTIRKVNTSGVITTVAGRPYMWGYSGDNGPATAATFEEIGNIAFDKDWNLLVTDYGPGVVRKIDRNGIITTFAGSSEAGLLGYSIALTDQPEAKPLNTILGFPVAVGADAAGNVYVGDGGRLVVIRKISQQSYIANKHQTLSICHNISSYSLDSILRARFSDTGHVISWSVLTPPLHGNVATGSGIASNGWICRPEGYSYTPDPGYVGSDNFSIRVSNVTGADTMFFVINIEGNPQVDSFSFLSADICQGATTTFWQGYWYGSATPPADYHSGQWVSSDTSILKFRIQDFNYSAGFWFYPQIQYSAGPNTGPATLMHTITNSCGTASVSASTYVHEKPDPGTITTSNICLSNPEINVYNSVAGGYWTMDYSAVANLDYYGDSYAHIVGLSSGTATISYTVNNGYCSATATANVAVSNRYDAGDWNGDGIEDSIDIFDGSIYIHRVDAYGWAYEDYSQASICPGQSIQLGSHLGSGTWYCSSSVGHIDPETGVFTGIDNGYAIVEYHAPSSCGEQNFSAVVMVGAFPGDELYGPASVCAGSTINLTNYGWHSTGVEAWQSSNASVATVDVSGNIAGVSGGVATISYSITSCSATSYLTRVVTVNPTPIVEAVTGASLLCVGTTTSVANSTSGGSWSVTDPSIASIDADGVVYGIATGNTTISYTVGNSCGVSYAIKNISVNATPAVVPIIGLPLLCLGSSITLSETTSSGVWSSNNTSIATVDATTGIVYGITTGNTTISYTVTNSCGSSVATKVVTVNPLPDAGTISGASTVDVGSDLSLAESVAGGNWSISNNAVATISNAGILYGVTSGAVTVTYTVSNSCGNSIATHTVNVLPVAYVASVTGSATVCAGGSISLADSTAGGVWGSSDNAIATVDASGIVYGVSQGNVIITYTVGSIFAVKSITVNVSPDAGLITGISSVCTGSSINLMDSVAGGTWSSSNTSVATISASGVLSGVASGSAIVTYTISGICGTSYAIHPVTVYSVLPAISGTSSICSGTSVSLNNTATGGTWSASNTKATVNASTGVVTGVATGAVTITYTGCGGYRTFPMTVNASPAAISGANILCAGAVATMSDATSGGTWSMSAGGIATINPATRVVSAVTSGNATVSYTLANGCYAVRNITVNIAPAPLAAPSSMCVGSVATLSNAVLGGTWSTSQPTKATITADGVLTALSPYSPVVVRYSIGSCITSSVFTVNTAPAAFVGVANICAGYPVTLTNTVLGGTWSSSDNSIATIGGSGAVTGVAEGSAVITYAIGSCYKTKPVVVNTSPAPISPIPNLCVGVTMSLSNPVLGGTWTTSQPTKATVTPDGVMTTLAAYSPVVIRYIIGSCTALTSFTVSPTPSQLTGVSSVCSGSTVSFTGLAIGGVWSSADDTIATVSTAGTVAGVSSGSTTISYSIGSCYLTKSMTVNPAPAAIPPIPNLCTGVTMTLSNSVPGGTWTTSQPTKATITPDGVMTTLGAYSPVTIRYTIGSCVVLSSFTVNATPAAITGPSGSICAGSVVTLSSATAGGIWSVSEASIATVVNTTGTSAGVKGLSAGATTITYSTGSCYRTKPITVDNCGGKEWVGQQSVTDVNSNDEVHIYPNPATGTINIDCQIATNTSLYSADGRHVFDAIDVKRIDMSTLANGLYLLKVYDHAGKLLKQEKIVKE